MRLPSARKSKISDSLDLSTTGSLLRMSGLAENGKIRSNTDGGERESERAHTTKIREFVIPSLLSISFHHSLPTADCYFSFRFYSYVGSFVAQHSSLVSFVLLFTFLLFFYRLLQYPHLLFVSFFSFTAFCSLIFNPSFFSRIDLSCRFFVFFFLFIAFKNTLVQ